MTGHSPSQPNISERLERVDASLAAQLGKSIELNARLIARIEELEKALQDISELWGCTHHAKEIARAAMSSTVARSPGEPT